MNAKPEEMTSPQPRVSIASRISGVGMAVPDRVVTNEHFASYLDTTDEWIRDRTGISERRWSEPGVPVSEFAERACRQALTAARIGTDEIDGIICATVTPDYVFPSTACVLQGKLGVKKGLAFDINAVCSGFLYALVTADSLIASGQCTKVLVVGADLYSRIINPQDRSTCILFGDGAGAVVVEAVASNGATAANIGPAKIGHLSERFTEGSVIKDRGIYSSELSADGSMGNILCVPSGTAKQPTPESLAAGEHYLTMAGREVFKLAVRSLVDVSERLLERAGFEVEDVDYFISHQANQRILLAMARQLGAEPEKVLSNVAKYGNTSAASLPILLAEAAQEGKLKKGDLVLLSAFGGGLTWGAMLLRW